MLNLEIFSNRRKVEKLLCQPVAVIHNALENDVAEKLHSQLNESKLWKVQQTDEKKRNKNRSDFDFKRMYIDLDNPDASPAVSSLYNYLIMEETRKMFSDICGNKCDIFRATATIFNKGDFISEHNDLDIYEAADGSKFKRVLTFNYYLSKNWNSDWGGNLVWKKPYQVINPSFNTLVLFKVTTNSEHQVDPVLIDTNEKRLSITGWYLEKMNQNKFKLSI